MLLKTCSLLMHAWVKNLVAQSLATNFHSVFVSSGSQSCGIEKMLKQTKNLSKIILVCHTIWNENEVEVPSSVL
jgi:hypothetical protein